MIIHLKIHGLVLPDSVTDVTEFFLILYIISIRENEEPSAWEGNK